MFKRSKHRLMKVIITFVLFTGIIGSSVVIAFAHEDISSLLTNWFNEKTDTMIGEVNDEIEDEKRNQEERLEEELTTMIQDAEQSLLDYTNEEKKRRVDEIKAYADKLLNEYDIDHDDEKEKLTNGFEEIISEAEEAMEELAKNEQISDDE